MDDVFGSWVFIVNSYSSPNWYNLEIFFVIIQDYIFHYYWVKVRSAPFSHGGDESIVLPVVSAIFHTAF